MTRRTGVPSLIKAAERLCYLILIFSPVIRAVFPDETELLAALAAANAACEALHIELEKVHDVEHVL